MIQKSKWAFIGLIVLLFIIHLGNRACKKDHVATPTRPVLKQSEKAKVVVRGHNLTQTTRDKEGNEVTTSTYVPDTATIVTDDKGNVRIKVKRFGFALSPGIGASFYRDRVLLSIDTRTIYLHRFSLNVGLGFDLTQRDLLNLTKPYLAVSYALPFRWTDNTSVYVGRTLDAATLVGIRLSF